MTDPILHHYPASPFAEKIRAILGYKGLAWGSVVVPVIMPKPDLTALTGGYRKTPVLQVGCDVYCDTVRIAQLLDELHPERPLFRPEQAGVAVAAGRFYDTVLFFAAIALLLQPGAAGPLFAHMPPAEAGGFAKDRADLMRGARFAFPTVGEARGILADTLARLDAQLARLEDAGGRRGAFLFGAEPGWADFCAYHPLHALRGNPALASELAPCAHVLRWMDRIAGFGHGTPRELSGSEALAIARQAKPRPIPASAGPPLDGLALGDAVEVAATDYGTDPVRGTLVHFDAREIAVERDDERAGTVVVHVPRMGFGVRKAG
jgi:glutathione S-transferase